MSRHPLPLFRLLEQEYEALHGPLPASYVAVRAATLERAQTALREAGAPVAPADGERAAAHSVEARADIEDRANDVLFGELARRLAGEKSAALCLSGGGIRSATFGLGVVQGLARHGLLERFHYLSTVSGGGYVGSWLTSWVARVGLPAVVEELKGRPASQLEPEPGPVRHLRNYSNYLSPKFGLLTADTWTLIATYCRNLLINWLIWVPLLLAVLAIPRWVIELTQLNPAGWFAHSDTILPGMAFACGAMLALQAIVYTCVAMPSVQHAMAPFPTFFRTAEGRDRWMNQTHGSFVRWWCLPLVAAAFCLAMAWAWWHDEHDPGAGAAALPGRAAHTVGIGRFLIFGVGMHVAGWLAANVVCWWRVGGGTRWREGWAAAKTFQGTYTWHELHAVVLSGLAAGFGLWVTATQLFPAPSHEERFGYFATFAVPSLLFAFVLAGAVYVGVASYWTSDQDREWWARASAWIMIGTVVWAGLCLTVIFGPGWLFKSDHYAALWGAAGGLTGLFALLFGASARTRGQEDDDPHRDWRTTVRKLAPMIAAPIAIVLLVACLSLVSSGLLWNVPGMVKLEGHEDITDRVSFLPSPAEHLAILHHTDATALCLAVLALVAVGMVMARLIDINRFSLHAIYRNRLIRAYLGASNPERRPNPFTGFDPNDNLPLPALAAGGNGLPTAARLFHVVNVALNLVKKDKENLGWQERKAESFTFSPLHAGNWMLGYRSTEEYGLGRSGRAVSLGTAIAISGAAASPNMGYHSSPAVTFLMTLFNLRLGWWLGNPGRAGQDTFDQSGPTFAMTPIIQEALGFTNDRNPYVYLSDGGHFENLGLYEMVLRRVRFLLVVDAGQDQAVGFDDLGNAIRKIRVDLGIPIRMGDMKMAARTATALTAAGGCKRCAVGRVEYSCVDGTSPADDGVLVYLKPVLCGTEPADVYNYAQTHPEFPHESTRDQWFSESQFESYRVLGLHSVEELCGGDSTATDDAGTADPFEVMRRKIEQYLSRGTGTATWQRDVLAALHELASGSSVSNRAQ